MALVFLVVRVDEVVKVSEVVREDEVVKEGRGLRVALDRGDPVLKGRRVNDSKVDGEEIDVVQLAKVKTNLVQTFNEVKER